MTTAKSLSIPFCKMTKTLYEIKRKDGFPESQRPLPPPFSVSTPYSDVNNEKESTSPLSINGTSPVLLLAIIILAFIFFVLGLIHLLFRFVTKRTPFSTIYHSNRFPESSGSHSLQRQLQQLFHLHDSGLDHAFVEALPVFYYRDIVGLKEPFDCAVCLYEFSNNEKLRLLPMCSHAFHIDCIDTWLLSNSTCPLCRGSLLGSSLPVENPLISYDFSREVSNGLSTDGENGSSRGQRPVMEDIVSSDKRVLAVKLGKFRSLNEGEVSGGKRDEEPSQRNFDARRCYSMGTVQYVEGESELQVAFPYEDLNGRGKNACSSGEGDPEDKKIKGRSRGDSFSVSKIWLWSKKSRFPNSSSTNLDASSCESVSMPIKDRTEIIRNV